MSELFEFKLEADAARVVKKFRSSEGEGGKEGPKCSETRREEEDARKDGPNV